MRVCVCHDPSLFINHPWHKYVTMSMSSICGCYRHPDVLSMGFFSCRLVVGSLKLWWWFEYSGKYLMVQKMYIEVGHMLLLCLFQMLAPCYSKDIMSNFTNFNDLTPTRDARQTYFSEFTLTKNIFPFPFNLNEIWSWYYQEHIPFILKGN